MQKLIITVLFAIIYISFSVNSFGQNVIASDIENFWNAHDKIVIEKDYDKQIKLINDLYINKGTKGLKAIMQARRYTDKQYVDAINNYPKFWQSVRKNTSKAKSFAKEIEKGVAKLRQIYPNLKPAKVYFTIGVFRTPGTTLDGMVLIGSELALSDENVDTSEFPKSFAGLLPYFKSNPIKNIVFLNVHEFVHTQQKTAIGSELLTQTIREGIAEFITVKALQMKSPTPAIDFGKENHPKIKEAFIKEMFSTSYYNWLWNNFDNQFKTRDLGYFVGYDIAEKYYENSFDKKKAIKELIELDLQNNKAVAEFVNSTNYFSKSVKKYRKRYEKSRPSINKILQFKNGSQNVNPHISKITIVFSEKMDTRFRGFNFGPLGGCSGKLIDSTQLMNADKVIYRFKDSSVPPQYHRSYEIAVTKNEARIVVDSYGDILSKDEVKLKDEQFAEVLEAIKQAKITIISDTSDDGSCSGGTSEYLDIFVDKKKIIDGNVYHCGKQDYGNMTGDFDILSDKLKSLFPNFQKLLR